MRRSHALKYLKSFLSAICRILLASAFWIAVNVFHRVEVHGLQNDNGLRPAYFAMCHRRDLDPMVEIPIVLGHRGWRALAGDVRFAMRSDAFSQGFLARIVLRPRWFASFFAAHSIDRHFARVGRISTGKCAYASCRSVDT